MAPPDGPKSSRRGWCPPTLSASVTSITDCRIFPCVVSGQQYRATNGRIRWVSRFPFRSAALSLAVRAWHSTAFVGGANSPAKSSLSARRWIGRRLGAMKLRLFALAMFFLFAAPIIAAAEDLARLNTQTINAPTNIEVNLRYARVAEESGQLEKAFAAYERVLIYDPNNAEAKSGFERTRVRVLPTVTEIFTEFGAGWDSNPHQVPTGRGSDADLFGRVSIRDERTLWDTRWRTTGLFVGNVYKDSGDLNYGFASGAVGPVYAVGSMFTMHPAIGGTASNFAHHLFYREGF